MYFQCRYAQVNVVPPTTLFSLRFRPEKRFGVVGNQTKIDLLQVLIKLIDAHIIPPSLPPPRFLYCLCTYIHLPMYEHYWNLYHSLIIIEKDLGRLWYMHVYTWHVCMLNNNVYPGMYLFVYFCVLYIMCWVHLM